MAVAINYIELYASDLEAVKTFYSSCFGWEFTSYGPTYVAFSGAGLDGGFELKEGPAVDGALVVLYHKELEVLKETILQAGGTLEKDTFSFPGGKRFEFRGPCGNLLAVWSV